MITIGPITPPQAVPATVVQILGSSLCLVRDDAGRTLRATTDRAWTVGARVAVLGGRIVGAAAPRGDAQTYYV